MTSTPDPSPTESTACAATSLAALLQGLAAWLPSLDSEHYCCETATTSGTVGRHLRHTLDHVQALVDGHQSGVIHYDRRARGTADEADRACGCARVEALLPAISALGEADPLTPITVELVVDPALPAQTYPSFLGREIAFVLHHAVHHNALIACIAAEWGYAMPATLSVAPATQAYDADTRSCAR